MRATFLHVMARPGAMLAMGAPLEGDTASKGLLDEMPDWVKTQIEMDDYVDYLKAPVGTWDGKTYRISIDGDCHTFAYRTDYFGEGGISGMAEPPKTWQEVNAYSKAVVGQTDPLTKQEFSDLVKFMSELGKVGPYAPSKSRVVRRWQSIEPTPENMNLFRRTRVSAAAEPNTGFAWTPVYSRVSGDLPLDDHQTRMRLP